jgi:hypothetical protein
MRREGIYNFSLWGLTRFGLLALCFIGCLVFPIGGFDFEGEHICGGAVTVWYSWQIDIVNEFIHYINLSNFLVEKQTFITD